MFQFLGRNSVGLDPAFRRDHPHRRTVSIPWSEFGWFGRDHPHHAYLYNSRFNSLVGIRLVWTKIADDKAHPKGEFQFLGRNSVGLDAQPTRRMTTRRMPFQFLGRNSVGLDQVSNRLQGQKESVSIPWSEFGWFGPVNPPG